MGKHSQKPPQKDSSWSLRSSAWCVPGMGGFGIMFLDREPPGFEARLLEAVRGYPAVTFKKTTDQSQIRLEYEWVAIEKFPLLKPGTFELFSIGLKLTDRDRFVASKRTIYLKFTYSEKNVQSAIHAISKLVASVTMETGAAVRDDETRQILSATEWTKLSLDSWIGEQVDIRRQITMHEYRDPELRRIITLGLRKFGVPERTRHMPTSMGSPVAANGASVQTRSRTRLTVTQNPMTPKLQELIELHAELLR